MDNLDNWIESEGVDTTRVGIVGSELEEAVDAPSSSPTVLNVPIVLTILRAIADEKNGMIEICRRASWVIVYTRGIPI